MHRSKLSTFVIDCQTQDLDAATRFWAAALGREVAPPQAGDDRYRDLVSAASEPLVMIQRVSHESRVHLDIETDDIEAEVARLVSLGARRIESVRTWVVMEAPTGQRFCVVRPQRGPIALGAKTWPSSEAIAFAPTETHAALLPMVGCYLGQTKTWLDADAPPEESLSELRIEPLLGGRFLHFQEHGVVAGKPHAGEMWLGFHRDAGQFELGWIDSFHTGTAMMWSSGATRDDGVIAVTGSYAAGDERWGWRTEIHRGDKLCVRAFNIAPSGDEAIAVETLWSGR